MLIRTFFWVFCGIIVVALIHGLLFVPAIMGQAQWIFLSVDRVPDKIKKQLTVDVHVAVEVASRRVSRASEVNLDKVLAQIWSDTDAVYDLPGPTVPVVQEVKSTSVQTQVDSGDESPVEPVSPVSPVSLSEETLNKVVSTEM